MFSSNLRQHIARAVRRQFSSKKDDPKELYGKVAAADVKELFKESTVSVATAPESPEHQWATSPYVEGTVINKSNEEKAERYKIDPSDTSVILFPGQGAQYVGMATNLTKFPEAMNMFEIASEVLKYDLLKLCQEGPAQKLHETLYCQPAIMVTSLAALERLKEERPQAIENCTTTAGFSLGEITALVFAGALPFDRAVHLVHMRAKLMQEACDKHKGGMATVLLQPGSQLREALVKAKEWCVERGVEEPDCVVANYLFPDCKVISGSEEALQYIETNLKKFKLRKMKKIPTSGAFHSSLMSSAVEPFAKELKKIRIEQPVINVFMNATAKRYASPTHILKKLPEQIVRSVKWEQIMHTLYDRSRENNYPRTFVCGPGNALVTILEKCNAQAVNKAFKIE